MIIDRSNARKYDLVRKDADIVGQSAFRDVRDGTSLYLVLIKYR